MKASKKGIVCFAVLLILVGLFSTCQSPPETQALSSNLKFEISFPSGTHAEPITGRVFVMISRNDEREPRLRAGSWRNSVPFFGVDVHDLSPGETVVIDGNVLGYPPKSLREIPEGDYYVQALVRLNLKWNDMFLPHLHIP